MDEKFKRVVEKFKEITKKECYRVAIVDGNPSILDNKIGGNPYLPIGEEYPKDNNGDFMPLLLQVNLKGIDLEGYPNSGILEIFTDKSLNWPCEYAIRYFAEGLQYQEELPEIDLSEYIIKEAYKIDLIKDFCHMPSSDYRFPKVVCPIVNEIYGVKTSSYRDIDDLWDGIEWYDVLLEETRDIPITIGGYANFTQSDPRHDSMENRDECLFKLDSAADYNKFDIGDSGILFAIISQQNIESMHFDKTFVDWDCC